MQGIVLYLIRHFTKELNDALRKRQKINLRVQASKFRVKDLKLAGKICHLWIHFRPQLRFKMSVALLT